MKKEKSKNLIRRLTAFAQQFADAAGCAGVTNDAYEKLRAEATYALTGRKPTGQHEEVARDVAALNAMGKDQVKRWLEVEGT